MIYAAFVLGLLGSFHCVGMCGPLTFLLPLDSKKPLKKAFQIVNYHLGKAVAYILLGLVFGLLGRGLFIREYQQHFSIFVGIVMIVAVLLPMFKLRLHFLTRPIYFWVGRIKSLLGNQLRTKTIFSVFLIGFFNGYLPCGLVYMALFGALAQESLSMTLLYMLAFAMGTVPLLTLTIYLGNFLSARVKSYVQKAIPFFILVIGALFILRGLALGIPYISPSNMNLMIKAEPDCMVPGLK